MDVRYRSERPSDTDHNRRQIQVTADVRYRPQQTSDTGHNRRQIQATTDVRYSYNRGQTETQRKSSFVSLHNRCVLLLLWHSKFVTLMENFKINKSKFSHLFIMEADKILDFTSHWLITQKRLQTELSFFTLFLGKSIWYPMYDQRYYAFMTLNFYFTVKWWSRPYFESSYLINLGNDDDMEQVTIDSEWEVMHGLSTGIFTFDLVPLKVNVKVNHI